MLNNFQPDVETHLDQLYAQHASIPRWQRTGRDSTGGGGLSGQAIAHARRSGDELPFVFKESDGSVSEPASAPSDVQVRRVSFQYLGGPQHPAYLPPASFLPNSPLIPLRASSVSSASPAPGIAGHAIRSGEFLIPPTAAAPNPANRALAAAWRTSPWLWPYGAYQVTVTSATGTTRVILDLMLTD